MPLQLTRRIPGFPQLCKLAALLAGLSQSADFTRCANGAPAEYDPRRDATVEAVKRVMPCVVNIATEEIVPLQNEFESLFREFFDPYNRRRQPNTQLSVGSGVVIDEEGFVLTNFHVVSRARRVWVKFADGREFEAEKIVGTSYTDLALVKIRVPKGEKFPAVRFAADDDLLLGETVLALGNPFGLGGSVSRGILSSKSRRLPTENEPLDIMDWLQTDASINPGNSGGPLLNLRGDLIGINVAVYREAQGIGFAIPVKRISAALADIYSPEVLEKMWFGARVRPGLPLRILSVQVESPAGRAGLRPGDVIVQINGREPRSFIDFNRELAAAKDQRDVTLLLQRGPAQRPATLRLVREETFFNGELIRRKIGATVQPMTAQVARELNLGRQDGFVIASVEAGSAAAAANLARGMIISGIDGQAVPDLVAAARTLYPKGRGDRVRLDLVVPRPRGVFVELVRTTAELTLR